MTRTNSTPGNPGSFDDGKAPETPFDRALHAVMTYPTISVAEAAILLRSPRSTTYAAIAAGTAPFRCTTVQRKIYVISASVRALLELDTWHPACTHGTASTHSTPSAHPYCHHRRRHEGPESGSSDSEVRP